MAMTRDEMVELLSRWHAAIGRHDVDGIVDAHAEHSVMDSPTAGGSANGREAIAKVYDAWFSGFPDLTVTPPELVIDGNQASAYFTISGTDAGGFMGLPATGKPFRVPLVFLIKAENGFITYCHPVYDFSGLLIQIGVLKVKAT
jgi:steroid delta-isomerase-like uncharacterized protein